MRTLWLNTFALAALAIAIFLLVAKNVGGDSSAHLVNMSYGSARESSRPSIQQIGSLPLPILAKSWKDEEQKLLGVIGNGMLDMIRSTNGETR